MELGEERAALVELARQGNLRRAAGQLFISEQGLRTRLLTLERRLGVELYRKSRGMRRATPLTERGREFLPHAQAFLERARELGELFRSPPARRDVHVAASEYLTVHVLIDAVRRFHRAFPEIHIRLSTRSEREVEQALLAEPELAIGVAAPYEPAAELAYDELFALSWSLIAPARHPLLRAKKLNLAHLADQPLILFERGSTGR